MLRWALVEQAELDLREGELRAIPTSRRRNASRTAPARRAARPRGRPCRRSRSGRTRWLPGEGPWRRAGQSFMCSWIAARAASPWPVRILSKIAIWLCSRGVVPAASSSARARGTLASWPRPSSCLARASAMWASAKPSSAATASAKAASVPAVADIRLSTPRDIGIARRRRGRAQLVAVAILQHHPSPCPPSRPTSARPSSP
jgi:hypothetical protein